MLSLGAWLRDNWKRVWWFSKQKTTTSTDSSNPTQIAVEYPLARKRSLPTMTNIQIESRAPRTNTPGVTCYFETDGYRLRGFNSAGVAVNEQKTLEEITQIYNAMTNVVDSIITGQSRICSPFRVTSLSQLPDATKRVVSAGLSSTLTLVTACRSISPHGPASVSSTRRMVLLKADQ